MILVRCFCPSTAPGPMTQPGLWQLPWIKACCTWGVTNWKTSHTTAQTSMTQSSEAWEKFSFRVYRYGVWLLMSLKQPTWYKFVLNQSHKQVLYTAVRWHSWSQIVLKAKFVIPYIFQTNFSSRSWAYCDNRKKNFLSRIFFVANKKQKLVIAN